MVGKSVVFTAEITNPGQQPVSNVVVSQQADAALVVTQASEGAVRKGNDLVWSCPLHSARQAVAAPGAVRLQAAGGQGLLPLYRHVGKWPVGR